MSLLSQQIESLLQGSIWGESRCGTLEGLAINMDIVTVHFFQIVTDQLLSTAREMPTS